MQTTHGKKEEELKDLKTAIKKAKEILLKANSDYPNTDFILNYLITVAYNYVNNSFS